MRNRKFLLVLAVFLLIGSFSVMAAGVPAPGEILSSFIDWLIGVFSGENEGSAYLLTIVGYFIIFMTIYVQGLIKIKFFGDGHELSTSGKWFAFAAAMLSTLGLSISDKVSGVAIGDRFFNIFGVWGSLVLVGFVSTLIFRGLKHTGWFEEKILLRIVVAVCLGLLAVAQLTSGSTDSQITIYSSASFGILSIVLLITAIVYSVKGRKEDKEEKARDEKNNQLLQENNELKERVNQIEARLSQTTDPSEQEALNDQKQNAESEIHENDEEIKENQEETAVEEAKEEPKSEEPAEAPQATEPVVQAAEEPTEAQQPVAESQSTETQVQGAAKEPEPEVQPEPQPESIELNFEIDWNKKLGYAKDYLKNKLKNFNIDSLKLYLNKDDKFGPGCYNYYKNLINDIKNEMNDNRRK
jgi:hypothetical protein